MKCPSCHADNIAGVDQCTECQTDLRHLDVPAGRTSIERSMMRDPIADLIPRDPLKVGGETPVRHVVQRLIQTGRNCALVVSDDGAMIGIFTERDVLLRTADRYPQVADRPVREFMTPDPERVRPDDTIAYGLNRMMVGDYRHMPIEREGKAMGVVSVRHILGYIESRHPEALALSE